MTQNTTVETTQELLRARTWNILQLTSWSPDLDSSQHAFPFTSDKSEGRNSHKRAAPEGGASKGKASQGRELNIW